MTLYGRAYPRQNSDFKAIKSPVSQAGFTLIELLITLAITAFIGLLASQLISTGFKTQVGVKDSARQLENTVRIWLTIENDMSQVIQRAVRNEQGEPEPTLQLKDNVLTFTRSGWSNPLKEDRSTFQRVEYRFKEAESNRRVQKEEVEQSGQLIRRFWFALDRAPDSEPIDQTFSHVSEFSIQVMANDGNWVTSWPPPSDPFGKSVFPIAIKVTMGVNHKPAFERLFELMSPRLQSLKQTTVSSPDASLSDKASSQADNSGRKNEKPAGVNDAKQ